MKIAGGVYSKNNVFFEKQQGVPIEFLEKFALLVVEECAELIDIKRIADMLREHFEDFENG